MALLEYLVLKMLTGNVKVIEALRQYIVDGLSPSSVADNLGLSKHQVRGYAQRVIEKVGDSRRASMVISKVYDMLIRIEPVIKNYGGRKICVLCGEELRGSGEDHIRKRHYDIVRRYVKLIASVLRMRLREISTHKLTLGTKVTQLSKSLRLYTR